MLQHKLDHINPRPSLAWGSPRIWKVWLWPQEVVGRLRVDFHHWMILGSLRQAKLVHQQTSVFYHLDSWSSIVPRHVGLWQIKIPRFFSFVRDYPSLKIMMNCSPPHFLILHQVLKTPARYYNSDRFLLARFLQYCLIH